MPIILTSLLLVPLFAGSGYGRASFDCARARSYGEIVVCGNSELADKDSALAQLVQRVTGAGFSAAALDYEQRDWARERDACGSEACVRRAYDQRIAQLTQRLENVPEPEVSAGDPRRAALVDGLQRALEPLLGTPLKLQVLRLRERNGFAYARVSRITGAGVATDATAVPIHVLLGKDAGRWSLLAHQLAPEPADWKDWTARHGVPAELFAD